MSAHKDRSPLPRLLWLDAMRGISILMIAFFHFLIAYDNGRFPWPLTASSLPGFVAGCKGDACWGAPLCAIEGALASLFQRGPHAVAVFILLSGFGLTYSFASMEQPLRRGWPQWYWKRFLRLFPLYWAAHLLYLVSPFIHRQDPVDYRFLLSMLGDRVYPIATLFYYLNPAWWFFGMLIQFYLVFPLLFSLLGKAGPVRFLIGAGLVTIASRYLLVFVFHAHGNYVQGGFFGARLWEFAAGMALASVYRTRTRRVTSLLSSWWSLPCGLLVYSLGTYSYRPTIAYTLTDALIGTGLFLALAPISASLSAKRLSGTLLGWAGAYSYGIYLFHQPYVMYWGERLRSLSMPAFLLCATGILLAIAVASGTIERAIDRLTRPLAR